MVRVYAPLYMCFANQMVNIYVKFWVTLHYMKKYSQDLQQQTSGQ